MKLQLMANKIIVYGVLILFIVASISSTAFMTTESHVPVDDETLSVTFNLDGNILYVGGDGPGNYTRIQDAIDNTSDGDTVFVYHNSSPYHEHLIIDRRIALVGEDRDTTAIDGDYIEETDIVTITADGTLFSGFTIQYSGHGQQDAGIRVTSDHNTFCNLKVFEHDRDGIVLTGSSFNNISDNIFYGAFNWHLYLNDSSTDNIIVENTFMTGWGINMEWGCDHTIVSNNIFEYAHLEFCSSQNIISNNKMNNTGGGITFWMSDDNIITNNTITNGTTYGILATSDIWTLQGSDNNLISNNYIDHCRWGIGIVGTYPIGSWNNIVSNNVVTNFSDTQPDVHNKGISLSSAYNTTVSENIIGYATEEGIWIGYSFNNTISRNIIFGNKHGIRIKDASDNMIIENTLLDNRRHAIFENDNSECKNNTWDANYWGRPRLLPKIIFGVKVYWEGWIRIPRFNVDWHPARQPYG